MKGCRSNKKIATKASKSGTFRRISSHVSSKPALSKSGRIFIPASGSTIAIKAKRD
jgi:hypothetical protein